MGWFVFVFATVTAGGTTGRANCPEADHLYILGTEAKKFESDFGRNGSILFVARCCSDETLPRFKGVVTFPGVRWWITNPANQCGMLVLV